LKFDILDEILVKFAGILGLNTLISLAWFKLIALSRTQKINANLDVAALDEMIYLFPGFAGYFEPIS
jgi:hypothetical protein